MEMSFHLVPTQKFQAGGLDVLIDCNNLKQQITDEQQTWDNG